MAIKNYTLEHAGIIPDIFENKSIFLKAFGGQIQTTVNQESEATFLRLKNIDSAVVVQNYSTDPDVAFGTGTSNSNRYGERREIKATDVSVPYEAPLSVNEGVDKLTVNSPDYDEIVSGRVAAITAEWANQYDKVMGKAISDNASETLDGELTEAGVVKVFNDARKAFVVNKVSKTIGWTAYVTSDVFNLLVDSDLAKTVKGSTVDIDNGEIYKFKGFELVEVGEKGDELLNDIYFTANGVGVSGIAIEETRVGQTLDYAGTVIVSVSKLGKHIPEPNKKAIVVANLTEADELPEG